MNKIAKFEKVSYIQFEKDFRKCFSNTFSDETIKEIYDDIMLPNRATVGSAGYDFKMPIRIKMIKNESYLIPTGIRCNIEEGWVLNLYPRSGLGTKYKFKLDNTIGIIDSDYYQSDNEGHIMAKISQSGEDILNINEGQGFIQGVFVQYGITTDDDTMKTRNGGFGSSDR